MTSRDDPRPPAVKICGLRRREDVEAAVEAGAAFTGIVFAESPRRVTPEAAVPLAGAAREGGALPVGVFVDRTPADVARVAATVGLAVVQLHGDEGPEVCRTLRADGLQVWKALRPRDRGELLEALERYAAVTDALLVEGFSPERAGGTGTALPYAWLRDEDGTKLYEPLVLAGGLSPDNVAEAVRRVEPQVVDVSSGVEQEPGVKDPELVRRFVQRAREPGGPGS